MWYRVVNRKDLPSYTDIYRVKYDENSRFAIPTKVGVPFFGSDLINLSVDELGTKSNVKKSKVIQFVYEKSLEVSILYHLLDVEKRHCIVSFLEDESLAHRICTSVNEIASNPNEKVDVLYVFSRYFRMPERLVLRMNGEVCKLVGIEEKEAFEISLMAEYDMKCRDVNTFVTTYKDKFIIRVQRRRHGMERMIDVLLYARVLLRISEVFSKALLSYDFVNFNSTIGDVDDIFFCTTEQAKNLEIVGEL
jgi:hypothetical protein